MDASGVATPLPQEVEEGNVEYKLKLVGVTPARLQHLITQMNWRLNEGSRGSDGRGEAIYQLGFEDNGHPLGLSDQDLRFSIQTLRDMAEFVNAYFTVTSVQRGERGKVATVVVRRRLREVAAPVDELFLAAVGDAGVGKSTLAAVLTTGELDNGRGLARMQVLRHNHELEGGHTSAPSHVLLGFTAAGDIVNYDRGMAGCGQRKGQTSAAELIRQSTKLVTLLDLAGHPKYLKTTMGGLVGHTPDYVVLTVDPTNTPDCDLKGDFIEGLPLGPMSDEHLRIALALGLDLVVVATKLDSFQTPQEKDAALARIQALVQSRLGSIRQRPVVVVEDEAAVGRVCQRLAVDVGRDMGGTDVSKSQAPVPMVGVSSVSGEGLALLRSLFFHLPTRSTHRIHRREGNETLVRVADSFSVEDVGLVLAGTVQEGVVANGVTLQLGPDRQGEFKPVFISSIHVNRVAVQSVAAGRTATFAVKSVPCRLGFSSSACPPSLLSTPSTTSSSTSDDATEEDGVDLLPAQAKLRGMVMLGSCSIPTAIYEFDADVLIVEHPGGIRVDYEPIVHIHTVAQSARIIAISSVTPRSADASGSKRSLRASLPECEAEPAISVDEAGIRSFAEPITPVHVQQPTSSVPHPSAQPPIQRQAMGKSKPFEGGQTLSSGQRASARFRFVYKPEYVSPGDTFVFRERCMRGVGTVTACHELKSPQKQKSCRIRKAPSEEGLCEN